MPIANLMILEGRAPEVKQALIRAVTNAIVDSLQVKPESVRVIVQEIPSQHWGIGGISAKDLGR